ncbi:SusC/RagA family TonB-linked outer membrane protein [Sunxiuqinia sp. A32]|uniref:SusC/RagA family TonB-linked outer membrane protein n=1 Tax=Sunxiuqinia sp. A32 TaxID=3461496 RepID=UPI0040461980
MRLTIIVMLIALCNVHANSYSQNTKITLDFEDIRIDEVLSEIEAKSEFKFFVNTQEIDLTKRVSLNVKKERIFEILDQLFPNGDVVYEVFNKQIILKKSVNVKSPNKIKPEVEEAQQEKVKISGTVKDVNGSPLPMANIIEKGTLNGTQSDFDGIFTLEVADLNASLLVSYIGYLSTEVSLDGKSQIDVILKEDLAAIEEVIVVGYGTQKKEEVTSSIVRIDSEDFNSGNVNSPQQLLQGKVAGLNIAKAGGNPNEPFQIRLRGLSTFGANAEPLVIIDGVIGGSVNSVDPSDIASINVLKDASAAAIYGTRGSSGVIIITTKSGAGTGVQSSVEYNGYVAMEEISNLIRVANHDEYLEYGGMDFGSNTDWVDEVSRKALSHVHNVAFSGSSASGLNYRASINYRDVQGVIAKTGYDQVNARLNVSQRFLDDKLKLTGIMATTSKRANIGFAQSLRYAQTFNPTAPVMENRTAEQLARDPNTYGGYFETGVQDVYNPVALNEQNKKLQETKNYMINFRAELEVIDGLNLATNYSSEGTLIHYGEFFANNALFSNGIGDNGRATRSTNNNTSELFEFTATYNGQVGDLTYNALGGYSFQQFDYQWFSAYNSDFISNEVGFDNLGLGIGINNKRASVGSNREEAKLAAYFGRINLNYKNLAYLSASYRREASSRFGANNRWGNFWAVSGGVDLNEIFEIPEVDMLKLRAGYGLTGNEPVPRYAFLERLGTGATGFVDGAYIASIQPTSNPNPDLKWEEKGELNIGLDFAVLDSKLSGSFDYFMRNTTDLLNSIPVPQPPNRYGSTLLNIGELETKGLEVQLNYSIFDKKDFSWDFGANIATFKTKLIKLNNVENAVLYRGNLGAPGLNNTHVVRVAEGEEIGNIRASVFAGYDSEGRTLMINQETGEATTERNLDRDGQIVGNGLPDFTFGINNTLRYKDFDLNFFFRGAVGHSLVNIQRAYWEHPSIAARQNFVMTDNFNPDDSEQDAYHSGYVEKADFIKLDNATLGYNIDINGNKVFKQLRVYVAGNNLFTITKYSGTDPEVRYSDPGPITEGNANNAYGGDILVPGIDRRVTYFPTRTITFGVNVKF